MAQELREKMCLTLIPENTPIYEKMFDWKQFEEIEYNRTKEERIIEKIYSELSYNLYSIESYKKDIQKYVEYAQEEAKKFSELKFNSDDINFRYFEFSRHINLWSYSRNIDDYSKNIQEKYQELRMYIALFEQFYDIKIDRKDKHIEDVAFEAMEKMLDDHLKISIKRDIVIRIKNIAKEEQVKQRNKVIAKKLKEVRKEKKEMEDVDIFRKHFTEDFESKTEVEQEKIRKAYQTENRNHWDKINLLEERIQELKEERRKLNW